MRSPAIYPALATTRIKRRRLCKVRLKRQDAAIANCIKEARALRARVAKLEWLLDEQCTWLLAEFYVDEAKALEAAQAR